MALPVDPLTLLAFIPAGLALNLTPGADMMFCLGQGLKGGRRAAMAANFGIAVGGMVHTLIAGLGLGALIAAHPLAFDVIRWVGVGYLMWLAISALRGQGALTAATVAPRPAARIFGEALLVNLLNPKVILFILAFLPQFVDPAVGPIWKQVVLLGSIFAFSGGVVTVAYGVLAGYAGRALAAKMGAVNKVAAVLFAGLAAKLVLD